LLDVRGSMTEMDRTPADTRSPETHPSGTAHEPAGWWVEWFWEGQPRRLALRGVVRIGRSPEMDIAISDPYASRAHCTVVLTGNGAFVDARGSRNHVRIAGRDVEFGTVAAGEAFLVGGTPFRVTRGSDDETTLVMPLEPRPLIAHRSTRELVDAEGTLIARFSAAEFAIFEALALRFPDAAAHADLGHAVWGDIGYDQYQIHRLMQRVRQRLGDRADLLESVRAAGYRLRVAVEVR
jgi:Transcriptional regulatory protein, C terminal/FHA domain